jgi:diketogulonate reductase-like aldo/keto reductase
LEYVDLYLIHSPLLAKPDIPTIWKKMEKIKAQGLAKSIGVSNFGVAELRELVASAKVLPVVNQVNIGGFRYIKASLSLICNLKILFHPYVYAQQAPIIAFGDKYGIVTEGYSSLMYVLSMICIYLRPRSETPPQLTASPVRRPGGPLDPVLGIVAARLKVSPVQVLLAWSKAKGVVVVT